MFFDRPEAGRLAVVLQVHFRKAAADQVLALDSLAECVELARTAAVDVVDTVTATRDMPHPRWYVGQGKLEELATHLRLGDADLLIVNHELSAGQQRNLETELHCRVMTRTELILHIFADRARTYEGQLQVELAQLRHAQTRLVRGWTHLDRQKGGIGLRGAGETQLELDQRMLGERVKITEKRLADVARRRQRGRRRRQRAQIRTISLVGYTNAGKSTLFNALTSAEVLAEDKLFATLDPTMRQLQIPGIGAVVLADTVGFISHLPHSLIEAFKATLEEVANADLLLHVVDAADPGRDEHILQVEDVLREIGAQDVPTIRVFNKADLLPDAGNGNLCGDRPAERHADGPAERLAERRAGGTGSGVSVSAVTGACLDDLTAEIAARLGVSAPTRILLTPEDGKTRAWLYRLGAVIEEQIEDDGKVSMTLRADDELLGRLQSLPSVLLQPRDGIPKIPPLPN